MTAAPGGRRVSVGVQELIEKLRDQGVQTGRDHANTLVNDAEKKAAQIIQEARTEAEAILGKAHEEAGFITKAGKEALVLAERNAILELKDYLLETFSGQVGALVTSSLEQEELLQKMILAVAGDHQLPEEESIEVVLPKKVIGVDELRHSPELVMQGPLLEFVKGQAAGMLREGVTFVVSQADQSGVTFRLQEKDIEVELSDETIQVLLLKHLQPRFRALLEGIIK
jgi:V/A-type H+-transporting ATPase subunit E